MVSVDDEAPGWDAITLECKRVYGEQEPIHVSIGGGQLTNDLQGCSAYYSDSTPSHWHYVTYGLSDLYGDHDESRGAELTMRVESTDQNNCPQWPFAILRSLARQVLASGNTYEATHRIDLKRSVTGYPQLPGAPNTRLTVFAVCNDMTLHTVSAAAGDHSVEFLQLVGVTDDEKAEMMRTSTLDVLDKLKGEGNPLLVTQPSRAT